MSFKNSQYYKSVNKVRDFMFKDLEKTIDLVNAPKKAPNFLLALVLCCYTEYWGRLVLGIPVGKSEECFNEFFDRLGKCYQKRKQQGFDAYHDIRCGLVHSSVIDKSAKIRIKGDNCGIVFDQSVKEYKFHVRRYFKDFRKAVDNYLRGLETGSESVSLMEKALSGKPELI
jgi:hypothetical protein